MATDLLIIFVKFPEPGKVKTRLAKSLGSEGAADAYRWLVARVAENVVEPSGEWAIWVIFDPAEREGEVREWLEPLFGASVSRYVPQADGDLGARLGGAFAAGFDAGFEKVAAIGTDCVDLGLEGIRHCWRSLEEHDVVFGPADDGGYYLVGLKSVCARLFTEVPWSHERTLEVSRGVAASEGLSVAELEVLSDVDEIEQWEDIQRRRRHRVRS
ncbi:MAG: rSAM/selenodomain-associated transferase 1 [Verrucomicrobiales bacterium]|jgi:rSAM/selenodomain-associated transferase 1